MQHPHHQTIGEVATHHQTNPTHGLTTAEATARLAQHGRNELIERGRKTLWAMLWDQLSDIMVVILIVAAVISALIGEVSDTIVILIIVLINAGLGLSQEYRAEQAMAALKKLAVPHVRVRRNGTPQEISARDLVPGDVVLLEAGNVVPADGRVIEEANLRVEEAALTGESEPVEKHTDPIHGENVPLGDQKNMVFMGTTVTYGRGAILITSTGMATQLGRIADLLQEVSNEQTPLQRRLGELGKTLAWVALAIVALVFILGMATSEAIQALWASGAGAADYLRHPDVHELFLTAISMAVAAVPEGLPAVVTVALALGSQRLLKRQSLIRKLPAVETLGSVTVICSDKTGTLTENRMTVTLLDVVNKRETVEQLLVGDYELARAEGRRGARPTERSLALLLRAAVQCNDGQIATTPTGKAIVVGDPTETALIAAANLFGLDKEELDGHSPRVAELPFTSERKRMTTIHSLRGSSAEAAPWGNAPYVAFTKGAVDGLLDIASHVWVGEAAEPLTAEWRTTIEQANANLAQTGHRVLGAAYRPLDHLPRKEELEDIEAQLTFIGFMGMIDPPREEVKAAVAECRTAGIRPIMITGDHPLTAQYIAQQLDIARNGQVVTGQKLAHTSPAHLGQIVPEVSVYARVSPEHKLNIVQALQTRGEVVAMTGDGVNDAPALKRADIGVAMGITGTDVSKEAADMVLLDDNFATIVAAVREGRTIYDNIRKFIKYTFSSNIGEVLVMLFAPFFGMPLPLIPIQILWINLVTDGVPGLALAVEPSERNTMKRPPYHPQESIFSRGVGLEMLLVGTLIGVLSLLVGYIGYQQGLPQATWRTMVFTTLTLAQMGNALALRSHQDSLFTIGLFTNKLMLGAVVVTVVLQLMLLYIPFWQEVFRTAPLSLGQLGLCVASSGVVFAAVEAIKWQRRQREGGAEV